MLAICKRSTKFCIVEAKFSVLELVFYGQFCFSRPDLDGNKPAKGKCLARINKGLSSSSEGHQFFFFEKRFPFC